MDNNVTDDVIDVEDELIKTKDYIKKDHEWKTSLWFIRNQIIII